ncbi:MAG: hypothetical protein ACOCY1_05125 [Halovenus sp.]
MSSATPLDPTASTDRQTLQSAVEHPVRLLGFWSAIVTPFVILSLLATGAAQQSPALVGGLVAANVAGLVLGKEYKR